MRRACHRSCANVSWIACLRAEGAQESVIGCSATQSPPESRSSVFICVHLRPKFPCLLLRVLRVSACQFFLAFRAAVHWSTPPSLRLCVFAVSLTSITFSTLTARKMFPYPLSAPGSARQLSLWRLSIGIRDAPTGSTARGVIAHRPGFPCMASFPENRVPQESRIPRKSPARQTAYACGKWRKI